MKFLVLSLLIVLGCSEEDKKGASINAPQVEPPVQSGMPAGFKSTSLNLTTDNSTFITAIKDYLYPTNGFVGPLERVALIDTRMTSLNSRAEESENTKACLEKAAASYSIGADLPAGETFDLYFQCQEELGGDTAQGIETQQLSFGKSSDGLNFYVAERRYDSDGGGIYVMVDALVDGSQTELWDIRHNIDGATTTTTFLHILGTTGGNLEVSTASSGVDGGGMSCGVQMKSNGSLIYIVGSPVESTTCGSEVTLCLDATSLEEKSSVADCTTAGLDTFTFEAITPATALSSQSDAATIVAKKITGFTDFSQDVEVTE